MVQTLVMRQVVMVITSNEAGVMLRTLVISHVVMVMRQTVMVITCRTTRG